MHVRENSSANEVQARFQETASRMRRRAADVTAFELADRRGEGVVIEMPVGEDESGWHGEPFAWVQYWDGEPSLTAPSTVTVATYRPGDSSIEARLGLHRDVARTPGGAQLQVDGELVDCQVFGDDGRVLTVAAVGEVMVLIADTTRRSLALQRVADFDTLIDNTLKWAATGSN